MEPRLIGERVIGQDLPARPPRVCDYGKSSAGDEVECVFGIDVRRWQRSGLLCRETVFLSHWLIQPAALASVLVRVNSSDGSHLGYRIRVPRRRWEIIDLPAALDSRRRLVTEKKSSSPSEPYGLNLITRSKPDYRAQIALSAKGLFSTLPGLSGALFELTELLHYFLLFAAFVARLRRCHVHRGILLEETGGFEHKASIRDWHHRPVLGPWNMVHAE